MGSSSLIVPVFILSGSAFGGVAVALHIARRLGRFLNFRTLVILNYILVGNISGLVHLANVRNSPRGYFDMLSVPESVVSIASFGTGMGLIALCIACSRRLPLSPPQPIQDDVHRIWLFEKEKRILIWTTAILLPLTVYSTIVVLNYAESVDATRIISVSGGNARFSFMSGWFAWAVSFIAILAVAGRRGQNRIYVLAVSGIAAVAIVMSLMWTGGRSVIVVMAAPLILVLMPKLRGVRWLAVPAGITGATAYIVSVTEARTTGRSFNIVSWADWEWGRFSMLGYAHQHVEAHGYLWGETFLSGVVNVAFGAFRLLGIPLSNPDLRISTQLTGDDILGDSSKIYIVPGMNAELYMNFGVAGIFVGCYILGLFANWADSRFVSAKGPLVKLVYSYLGILLVFRTIAADSGSIYSYIFYTGVPLLVIGIYSARFRSRAKFNRIRSHSGRIRAKE